jgi:histone H3/H4
MDLCIPKREFQAVVRDIFRGINPDLRCQSKALLALQEAAEAFLQDVFTQAEAARQKADHDEVTEDDFASALRRIGSGKPQKT